MVSRPSKNMIQIRSFPQIETKNIWTHQLGLANSISNPNGKWFFWGIPCMWPKVCQGKTYGCFQNWWYPQIIHFNRVFHYKPSILGTPFFGNIQSAIRWRETHFKKKIKRGWRLLSPNHLTQRTKRMVLYGSWMFLMVLWCFLWFLMVFQFFSWCFLWFLVLNERDFGLRFLEKLSNQQQTISFISQSWWVGVVTLASWA